MWRMYFEFARISFRRAAAYRFDAWVRLFSNFVFLFMWIFIWQGLYMEKDIVEGVSFHGMVSYVLISQVLQGLHGAGTPLWEIQERVRSGDIVMELMRPYSYPLRMLFADLGSIFFYFIIAVLPLYTALFFIFEPAFPQTWFQWLFFICAAILGYLIRFCIELTFGLFSFWLVETGGVEDIFYFSITLFSGSVIPLWFFPSWLREIASLLPFQGIFFVPNAIFVGELGGVKMFKAMGVQLIWLVITVLVLRYVWHRAASKVVVQGG